MPRKKKVTLPIPGAQKKYDNIQSLLGTLYMRLNEFKELTYSARDRNFIDDVISDLSDIREDVKDWRRDPEGFLTDCGYKYQKTETI